MAFRMRVVFVALCVVEFGLCAVQRDRTVFTKLSLLEEEINAMKGSIQRNEVLRKTDLQILRHDINIKLESIAARVLSEIIDDKTKAGEIRGVVDGSVNTLLQHQQTQLQQMKYFISSVGARQPLPVPAKAQDSSKRINKRFRAINKKLKQYEKITKDLRNEILQQNLQIRDFKSEVSEQMHVIEELRRKREKVFPTEHNTKLVKPLPQPETSTRRKALIPTVEACKGSDVVLICSYTKTDSSQVAWMKENGLLISHNKRVIISDRRFSVQRPYTSEWNLKIESVEPGDEGIYVCGVQGQPLISRKALRVNSC